MARPRNSNHDGEDELNKILAFERQPLHSRKPMHERNEQ